MPTKKTTREMVMSSVLASDRVRGRNTLGVLGELEEDGPRWETRKYRCAPGLDKMEASVEAIENNKLMKRKALARQAEVTARRASGVSISEE
jgi:hypothetical protein